MAEPELLFVCGLGRSGTSALATVMSSHPKIALGMERYKVAYNRHAAEMTRDMFEPDRFFDFSDGLTNIRPDAGPRWQAMYEALAAKWESATYVGDKMTTVRMQQIWSAMPDARFVCIIRDVEEVAASWERRAKNAADVNWSERANARGSVVKWNQTLRRIRRGVKQRPDRAVVVEHAQFFGDPAGRSMAGVLEWLGLERATEMDEELARAHARFVESVVPKERSLTTEDAAYVRETADLATWRQLLNRVV